MTTAGVLLAAGGGSRFNGPTHKLRAELDGEPILRRSVAAMRAAGFDECVVVVGDDHFYDLLADEVTVVVNAEWDSGQASTLHAAIAHATSAGHEAVVVGIADQPLVGPAAWRRLAESGFDTPIVAASFAGRRRPPVRLDAEVWHLLPETGDSGARELLSEHPDLVTDVEVAGDPSDVDTAGDLAELQQRLDDRAAVTALLGREPQGRFEVMVRDSDGTPVVLRNHPILDDGRPMPTLYWLCGTREQLLVGRLESMKGVQRAEEEIGLPAITAAHERYAAERDTILDDADLDPVHRPSGGVGGTRQGVKCLHAHYGWWLVGGDDPVGQWVADHLHEVDYDGWPEPQ